MNDELIDLMNACRDGEYHRVRKILLSDNPPDINSAVEFYKYNYSTALMNAVVSSNLQLVEFLLLSPELKENAAINLVCIGAEHQYFPCALSTATTLGAEKIVDFLLNSPKLKEHALVIPSFTTIEKEENEIIETNRVSYSPLRGALMSNQPTVFNHISSYIEDKAIIKNVINDTLANMLRCENSDMVKYLLAHEYLEVRALTPLIEHINDRKFYHVMSDIVETYQFKKDLEQNLEHHLDNLDKLDNNTLNTVSAKKPKI